MASALITAADATAFCSATSTSRRCLGLARQKTGRRLSTASIGHQIPLRHFEELIDDRTALVAFAHVCYRNGVKQDASGHHRHCPQKGVPVLMDCYQSAGVAD